MSICQIESKKIYRILEEFFKPCECTDIFDKIGIQYHNTDTVTKVYTSTFASRKAIETVLSKNEKNIMLFTHHPVPPKLDENLPYPDIPKDLIREMQKNKVSLFSYHIPLDRHNPYSPSNTFAIEMGLTPYDTFYLQNGVSMGELCNSNYININEIEDKMETLLGHTVNLYKYGTEFIQNGRVAVMSGCAKNPLIYSYLKDIGINVFLTGVTNQDITWVPLIHENAKENGINIIGGTHYSTEKFAAVKMTKFFERLGIQSEFIEESPNLGDI